MPLDHALTHRCIAHMQQVRHFVPMLVAPQTSQAGAHYLDAPVLPYVLPHPNEWNDDLTATRQPSLHFVVYVPSGAYTPLHIRDEGTRDTRDTHTTWIGTDSCSL